MANVPFTPYVEKNLKISTVKISEALTSSITPDLRERSGPGARTESEVTASALTIAIPRNLTFYETRQGVSRRAGFDLGRNNLPHMGSKHRVDIDGNIDHSIEILNYGQATEFSHETLFDDEITTPTNAQAYLEASSFAYYPSVLFGASYRELNLLDGTIEIMPIREGIPAGSIDSPYQMKGIKASIMVGSFNPHEGAEPISQIIELESDEKDFFIDSQERSMVGVGINLKSIGISSNLNGTLAPFDDTNIVTASIYPFENITSSSYRNRGISNQFQKLSRGGFDYTSNPDGSDSIAYGGFKR